MGTQSKDLSLQRANRHVMSRTILSGTQRSGVESKDCEARSPEGSGARSPAGKRRSNLSMLSWLELAL